MKRKLIYSFALVLALSGLQAQVGIGTENPRGGVDINSPTTNTWGLVLPTNDDANNIVNPQGGNVAIGTIMYDSTLDCVRAYRSTGWSGCIGDNGDGGFAILGACPAFEKGGIITTGSERSFFTMDRSGFLAEDNRVYHESTGALDLSTTGSALGSVYTSLNSYVTLGKTWVDNMASRVDYWERNGYSSYYFMNMLDSDGVMYSRSQSATILKNTTWLSLPLALGPEVIGATSSLPDNTFVSPNATATDAGGNPIRFSRFLGTTYAGDATGQPPNTKTSGGFMFALGKDGKVYSWGGKIVTNLNEGGGVASSSQGAAGTVLFRNDANTVINSATPKEATWITSALSKYSTSLYTEANLDNTPPITFYTGGSYYMSGVRNMVNFISTDGYVNYMNSLFSNAVNRVKFSGSVKAVSLYSGYSRFPLIISDDGHVYNTPFDPFYDFTANTDANYTLTSSNMVINGSGKKVIDLLYAGGNMYVLDDSGDVYMISSFVSSTTYDLSSATNLTTLRGVPKLKRFLTTYGNTVLGESVAGPDIVFGANTPLTSAVGPITGQGLFIDVNGSPILPLTGAYYSAVYTCNSLQ